MNGNEIGIWIPRSSLLEDEDEDEEQKLSEDDPDEDSEHVVTDGSEADSISEKEHVLLSATGSFSVLAIEDSEDDEASE